jgi:CRP/FNR family transcriptional regulator
MDEIRGLAQRLSAVPQFRDIPIEGVISIIRMGDLRNYTQGEIIFHEADACAGMFVLVKGRGTLNKLGPAGQESVLSTLEPVIMFNEVAALDGGVNPVSAVAHTDCRLWRISQKNMQKLIMHYPQIGLSLLGVLAMRNRQLVNYYSDLSFLSVHARLAKHLLDLSRQGEQPIDRKQNPIRLMAARIITTPEAISRTLKAFSTGGLIQYDRVEVKVIDLEGLNQAAQIKF